ncbi:MAG: hypothetical protein O3C43_23700 [Verrucomicrobia bacterium]|nr:hypothetical protein [Verrucomicrobiota bacterium]MDA1069490.1 hypothetical protein [Verrucomicrobiota bacterium]
MKSKLLIPILLVSYSFAFAKLFEPVVVQESFFTERNEVDNVDSLAAWHGPNGEHWLILTAKGTHALLIYDAFTGAFIKRVGEQGQALGQFNRPNGISILGDKVFVVERDNQRVQVLTLPDFFQLGSFGSDHLIFTSL